ncbi:multicomponent Na+:H+ antiporter subunit E [Kaistia soli DSM 19436]|uniref:Multicomponent Na+:H+ antiporter subunit E n=1 Tax=Kaistia soli DSM 19436 TaxID=1122133 RepID=A0A1M5GFN5_9HYPH|nr:Na+/H+ antiporter subunit E [Kaistia soli]SHG02312.1 multicomponent Na+:H+ antiporter subunit E [Kaistia soli DSM 19436]
MAPLKDVAQPARYGSVLRFVGFMLVFCILKGIAPADLAVGLIAALAATSVSLRLMPRRNVSLDFGAMIRFEGRFLRQSLVAGIDVARRAFDPALPLATGFITFRPSLRRGFTRDLFTTISSMMPGTLPVGEDNRDGLVVHCLDIHHPVAVEMAQDEARLRRIMTEGRPHG